MLIFGAMYLRRVRIDGRSYAAADLVEKHADAAELLIVIAAVLAAAADTVLVAHHFQKLCAYLVTARGAETTTQQVKGGFGVFPDSDTTQHAHAHNKPSALEKGHFADCNATQHATKREREKLPTS